MKGTLKSQDDVYVGLHSQLVRCDPLDTSSSVKKTLDQDLRTISARFKAEGLAFLTKTLPLLGKALDQGLVSGRLHIPLGFKRSHRSASIPAFLQAYFSLVFDEDGVLLDVASVEAVKHLRQVLYFAYKLELPYSAAETSLVIEKFVQTDAELELPENPITSTIIELARVITGRVFKDFDPRDIVPRHGPGAVATGERLEAKWSFSRLYNQIHQVYPYYDFYVVGGSRELSDRLGWYKSLQRLETGEAKVVLVPKDSRGPRLISCEPLEYQWIQQGLGRKLAAFLETDSFRTKGAINFTRQEVNRRLAETSSASQRYATLDLQDASDRVSLELVRRIFNDSPKLLRGLEACRTTHTRLPDGRVVPLKKFAPMGSALCFPVEAYIFWVTIVSAVVHYTGLPLMKVGKRIFVYGDDIIVPTHWAPLSVLALESVGLKVNASKCCITGNFRESCGLDAFKGVEVTPVRLKHQWTHRPTDGSALASFTSIANKLAGRGYIDASLFLWDLIERTYGKIPYGTVDAGYPHREVTQVEHAESLNMTTVPHRVNQNYQRLEFFLPSLSSRKVKSRLDGWPRLMRDLITPPVSDPSLVVVPRSTKIKRRWATTT